MNSNIKPVIKSLSDIHCASWWLLDMVGAKVLSVSCMLLPWRDLEYAAQVLCQWGVIRHNLADNAASCLPRLSKEVVSWFLSAVSSVTVCSRILCTIWSICELNSRLEFWITASRTFFNSSLDSFICSLIAFTPSLAAFTPAPASWTLS